MPELTSDQITTARAEWVAAGLDGAAFDRASTPDLRADPGSHIPAAGGDVHPAQAVGMVEGLLAGGVSRDAVKAALANDGFSAEEIARFVPDARTGSASEREFLAAGFAGARPDEYGSNLIPHSVASIVGDNFQEATAEWADNLSRMGVSVAAGSAVVEAALRQGQAWQAMDSDQRALHARRLDDTLVAVAGDEAGAKALVVAAQAALAKTTPEFRSEVIANGGLLDASVIVTLAMAAKMTSLKSDLAAGKTLAQLVIQ